MDKRIAMAREYLDTNFRSDNVLDGAAAASGLSRRRFGELFKNNFDVTPNRYLQIKRIEYSKELLGIQELSVGEVAVLCGFSDIYYFSRLFKKLTGITPSAYTRQ
jgi:AraC-like DNA-binding protein